MKSMKFVIGLLTAVALLSVSCDKTKEQTKKNPHDGVSMTFTLTVNNVESNSAEIRVRYTAEETLKWYYYLSDDLDSSLEDLVADGVALLDKSTTLEKLKSKVIALSDLEVETNYRFVVFGVDIEDDGTVWTYGTPAEISFKTSKDLNVIFSATEPVVERNSVKFTVSYDVDEDAEYTWYALLTKTISGTTANVIKSEVKNISADQLRSGKDVEISLSDLDFSTTYRIIVTGLLEDGTTYGTAADLTFQIGDKFYLESAWTLSHSIDETTYPGYPHKFTNTVAAGSNAGKYFITLYAESEIDDTSNLPAFIDAVLPDEVEYLEYLAAQNNKTLSYYLNVGTGSDWYKIAYKKYYIFAIGLTDEGEATGAYAYMTYYNEPDETAKAEYDKWLGNWIIQRGTETDVLTITQKELAASYNVLGLEGGLMDDVAPVEMRFDASYNMTLYAQSVGNISLSQMGVVEVFLLGSDDQYTYTFGNNPYKIADFVLNPDGSATVNAANGLNAFEFCFFYQSSIYSWQKEIELPTTMVRPSETGSEAYNKWLGNWTITRPEYTESTEETVGEPTGNLITDTWTISQNVADISYDILGVEGLDELPIKASFDAASGKLIVGEQSLYEYENETGEFEWRLVFTTEDKALNLHVASQPIFEGVINPDGTASLTGLTVEDKNEQQVTATGFAIVLLNWTESRLWNWMPNNYLEWDVLPNTLTPVAASGTSFKMKKSASSKMRVSARRHLFRPFSNSDCHFGYRLRRESAKAVSSAKTYEKKVK